MKVVVRSSSLLFTLFSIILNVPISKVKAKTEKPPKKSPGREAHRNGSIARESTGAFAESNGRNADRPSALPSSVIPSLPEVIPMPATARAIEPQIETLTLEDRIRRRAYELYVQKGNQSGSELDDWLQAEEEIRAEEEAVGKS